MQFRSYDEVDPAEVNDLTLSSFGSRSSEEGIRLRRRKDPRILDFFAVYAVVRGRPVAQVVPLKMDVRLTSGVETVGGIAGVCSHPSVWGQGYARRLMDHAHEIYHSLGYRIATLATSRNIRGYRLYRGLGYVDLAEFYRGTRRLDGRPSPSGGLRIRRANRSDLSIIQGMFMEFSRDLYGWTVRPPGLLPYYVAQDPENLARYRIVLRDGAPVGYLQTGARGDPLAEEVIIQRAGDFRAAIRALETRASRGVVTIGDMSSRRDLERFRSLGYHVVGPRPPTTMALSLAPGLPTGHLPRLFGSSTGGFVHYPTDDF